MVMREGISVHEQLHGLSVWPNHHGHLGMHSYSCLNATQFPIDTSDTEAIQSSPQEATCVHQLSHLNLHLLPADIPKEPLLLKVITHPS